MSDAAEVATKRARRLVRLYPRGWRARYGEEFTQLLVDDMAERPRSLGRAADVVRTAALARAASAGLTGDTLEPAQQIRASLATVAGATVAFLLFGVAVWAQLTIGWQWSAPTAPATKVGMLVMSDLMPVFAVLAVLAAIPLAWTVANALMREPGGGLIGPVTSVLLATALLVAGGIHFGHGWPGTGGHPWAGREVVSAGVARFCWAATLWVTSYWAHPGALASFPTSEIVWMLVSPVALVTALIGATATMRRLSFSPRVLRFELCLGAATALAMTGFLAGASSWVISGGPAPRGLFRVGVIDSVGIAVMGAAVIVAFRSAQRALSASFHRVAPR